MKIVDNYLEDGLYQDIKAFITGENIPWYLRKEDTINSYNKNGYYNFSYFNENCINHPMFNKHIEPILNKLNTKFPIEVRANLTHRDEDGVESSYHVDRPFKCMSAILFLTTCNSKTILKINNKEKLIDSVENRILLFESNILHKVKYQTDIHKRYIINFNYY